MYRLIYLLVVAGGILGTSAEPPQSIFLVPYRRANNSPTPIVSVLIDDRSPHSFCLDTGSTSSLISDTVVKALGLPTKPAINEAGKQYIVPGTTTPANMVVISRFQLTTAVLTDVPFLVVKEAHLRKVVGKDVDGLIGTNVLISGAMAILPDKQLLTFYFPGDLTRREVEAMGFSYTGFTPFSDNDGDFLFRLSVKLNDDFTTPLAFDTGAGCTVLSLETAEKLKLQPFGSGKLNLLAGPTPYSRGFLRSLNVGGVDQRSLEVYYTTDPKTKMPPVLGLNNLSGGEYILDFAGRKLFARSVSGKAAN